MSFRILVRADSQAAVSLAEKLAAGKEGEFIKCTDEEFSAFSSDMQVWSFGNNEPSKLIEVDLDKHYVLFADNSVCLEDILGTGLNNHISVVRLDK